MSILYRRIALALALSTTTAALARAQDAAPEAAPAAPPAAAALEPGDEVRPTPDQPPRLVPDLPTIPWRLDRVAYGGWTSIKTVPLPKDREGIWVLDFAYKPLRIQTVEIPGKGRRAVYYLYYKVVNHTGAPRPFLPQFVMVNERGQKFEDSVVPEAIPIVQGREDPTIALRGAVDVMGTIPESTKQGVDDAVFGVAVWDRWDATSDRFSIYVRGLSDGYKELTPPDGGKPIVRYKTLKIDYIRRGDELNVSEKEIEPGDPPYDWVYW